MRNRVNFSLLAALALGLATVPSAAVATEDMPPPPQPPRRPRRTELDDELAGEPLRPPPDAMADGCRWTQPSAACDEVAVVTVRRYREPGSLFVQAGGTCDAPPSRREQTRADREKKMARKRQRTARRNNR